MAHPIDLHVGARLRQRRRLLGMTQQKLAESVKIRFQQIQKYESGANRISASRLWSLSTALDVPVAYFFEGLDERAAKSVQTNGHHVAPADAFQNKETIDLVRAFYTLNDEPRRRLLDAMQTVGDGNIAAVGGGMIDSGVGEARQRHGARVDVFALRLPFGGDGIGQRAGRDNE